MTVDYGGGASPVGQSLRDAELAVLSHVEKQYVPMNVGLVRKSLSQGSIWRLPNDEA